MMDELLRAVASPDLDQPALDVAHFRQILLWPVHLAHAVFADPDRGLLNAFRHQQFLLFLIAHFHKAALLMFSDKLAGAINRLDPDDPEEVRHFRKATRQALETFLRFTHRYWFPAVSNQDRARDLFALCRRLADEDASMREYLRAFWTFGGGGNAVENPRH